MSLTQLLNKVCFHTFDTCTCTYWDSVSSNLFKIIRCYFISYDDKFEAKIRWWKYDYYKQFSLIYE